MLAGIGSGNMYFKISPTREIAKMIKNCLMNFMLVLPVFSSDCPDRAGSEVASGTGLVRIAEASWAARAAQAAWDSQVGRIGATNNYILVCGFVKMKLRNSAENRKKTRSCLEKIEPCADEFARKTGACFLVISDCRWRTVLLPP